MPPDAPDAELLPALRDRWSPHAFDGQPLDPARLTRLFEAARWAPSGGNRQPWRFLVARREDSADFARLFACLSADNQRWAGAAGALIAGVARVQRELRGAVVPYPLGLYELGLAVGQLLAQATALGLSCRQMGGFDPEALRRASQLPEDFAPAALIAVGRRGDPASLPADLAAMDEAARARQPLRALVWGPRFGEPAAWLPDP